VKLCLFNVENLYILLDLYNNQDLNSISEKEWQSYSCSLTQSNKPLSDIIGIKNTIQEIGADIYMLCEVGGKESLDNFNKLFLDNKYKVYIKEGNSKRGLCVGYLIKRGLPYSFSVKTNKNIELEQGKMTRDILQLQVFKKGIVQFICLLVHLKSKRSSDKDFNGISKRTAEIKGLIKRYKELKDTCKVPIVVAGDFNGHAQKSDPEEEFKDIYTTDLLDIHDILNTDIEERTSFVSFYTGRILRQLDYIFLSKEFHSKVEKAYNPRFKNEYGDDMGIPETFEEKRWLPSDHFPVVLELNLQPSPRATSPPETKPKRCCSQDIPD
jgi:endonuclease/exonuclease/phosphatase family metal-dependent hydrolase